MCTILYYQFNLYQFNLYQSNLYHETFNQTCYRRITNSKSGLPQEPNWFANWFASKAELVRGPRSGFLDSASILGFVLLYKSKGFKANLVIANIFWIRSFYNLSVEKAKNYKK